MVLSYPSLKCVLEHLEPNRRFQVASRCPSLYKTEKITPLHIENLEFRDWGVIVNDVAYRILSIPEDIQKWAGPIQDTVMLPGDVLVYDEDEYDDIQNPTVEIPEGPRFKEIIQITFDSKFGTVTREIANFEGLNPSQVIKKMLNVLFGDRKFAINVKNLNFKLRHERILRVPENVKIRARYLDSGTAGLNYLRQILTSVVKEHTVQNGGRISKGFCIESEKAVLVVDSPVQAYYSAFLTDNFGKKKELRRTWNRSDNVMQLVESWMYYIHGIHPEDALEVVRDWVENGRSLGMEFVFDDVGRQFMVEVMTKAKRRYGAFEVKLMKKHERCLLFPRPVTIPLSPISEILIIGIQNPLTGNNQLKVEVVKIGETSRISKNFLMDFFEFATCYFYIFAIYLFLRYQIFLVLLSLNENVEV